MYWWTRVILFGERLTSGKSDDRLEVGSRKSTGRQMEGDCYLLHVVASNTVSVIRTATSVVRLLLTHQRTIPWKTSGTGVAAQRTHSWSVTTQYKISSLVTAVSTSLWLAVAGAPENSSLATPQQADLTVAETQRKKSLLVSAAPTKKMICRGDSPTTFIRRTTHRFFNHVKVRFSLVSGLYTYSTKPWSHSDTMHMCADKAAFQMTSSKVLSMLSYALHDDLIVSNTCVVEVILQARKQCVT